MIECCMGTLRSAHGAALAWLAIAAVGIGCGGGGGGGGGGGDGIAAGGVSACALRDGTVSCWGWNAHGQLGDGTTVDAARAVRVQGARGAQAIATGHFHACAIVSEGVECWGRNDRSLLGNAAFQGDHSATPLRVDGFAAGVQALAIATFHTCALVNGGVRCWGDNTYRQLGASSGSESATPLQVPGLGSGVEAIAAGETHTCALVSGGVKCWGDGFGGVLGDNDAGEHSRATPYDAIASGSGATAVASSPATSCALVGGTVKCWGLAIVGMSGAGCDAGFCPRPVDVMAAPAGTTSLSVSDANLYLLVDGGVKAVGSDAHGELGDGEPLTSSTSLVDVTGLASGVAAVSARTNFACALRRDGSVRCWGQNNQRQLGDGTTTNRSAPVRVEGL